jgi:hypothetical protein
MIQMTHGRQNVLHADHAIPLGAARDQDAERLGGARLGCLDGRSGSSRRQLGCNHRWLGRRHGRMVFRSQRGNLDGRELRRRLRQRRSGHGQDRSGLWLARHLWLARNFGLTRIRRHGGLHCHRRFGRGRRFRLDGVCGNRRRDRRFGGRREAVPMLEEIVRGSNRRLRLV